MELTEIQKRMLEIGIEELAKVMGLEAYDFGSGVVVVKSERLEKPDAEFLEFGLKQKEKKECAPETPQTQTAL